MYLLRALLFCGSIVFFSAAACAQVGKETAYWKWTEPSDFHKGMVRVNVKGGNGLSWSGSGAVVSGNRILTAAHVLDKGLSYEVVFCDESVIAGSVVNLNTANDIGVLRVNSIPSGVTVLKVAEKAPEDGTKIEVCGFGARGPLRHFSGRTWISSEDNLGCDTYVIQGDSGGAVLNESGEIVGIVSGGMCWSSTKAAIHNDSIYRVTWPTRCGGVGAIQKALR